MFRLSVQKIAILVVTRRYVNRFKFLFMEKIVQHMKAESGCGASTKGTSKTCLDRFVRLRDGATQLAIEADGEAADRPDMRPKVLHELDPLLRLLPKLNVPVLACRDEEVRLARERQVRDCVPDND